MRTGRVSLVTPILSTEGAIAAVLAVVGGETLGGGSALLLAAIAGGVVLASRTATVETGQPLARRCWRASPRGLLRARASSRPRA